MLNETVIEDARSGFGISSPVDRGIRWSIMFLLGFLHFAGILGGAPLLSGDSSASAQEENGAPEETGREVALTIYNSDLALVKDVRVRELARGFDLPLEPKHGFLIHFVRTQNLDRHIATERVVVRDPHLTHPTSTDSLLELVATKASRFIDLSSQGPHLVGADDDEGRSAEDEELIEDELADRLRLAELSRHR